MRLHMAEKQVSVSQEFQILAEIVSQAFGSGKSKNEKIIAPKTGVEAVAQFNALMGKA